MKFIVLLLVLSVFANADSIPVPPLPIPKQHYKGPVPRELAPKHPTHPNYFCDANRSSGGNDEPVKCPPVADCDGNTDFWYGLPEWNLCPARI